MKTPAAPLDATVEFVQDPKDAHAVDASSPAVSAVRFGLWDNAFADEQGTLFNGATEVGNFVGADSRRFYIRVKDRSRAGSGLAKVAFRTRSPNLKNVVDGAVDPAITLLETGGGTGVFVSKALMLVRTNEDKQPVHSGLPDKDPDGGIRTSGMSNYRIRVGGMFGFVEAEYSPPPKGSSKNFASATIFTPIFQRNPDERKRLPVHVFILRQSVRGAPIVPTAPTDEIWARDLRIVAEVYERLGIFVDTVPASVDPKFNPLTVQGGNPIVFKGVVVDPPRGLGTGLLTERERNTIIAPAFPGQPDTIRIFYADQLEENAAGISSSDAITAPGDKHRGTSFLDPRERRPHTVAHEIGHLLTSRFQGNTEGHFATKGVPRTLNQNLMHSNPESSPDEKFNRPKRLWDEEDAEKFNQFAAIMGTHYLRPL